MNDFLLILTANAKAYLEKTISSSNALSIKLKPSGCSGYSNILTIEEHLEKEKLISFQGINFLLDEENKKYFNNSIIDYKKEGLNYKLTIENPNTKNHCGCGESFSLNEGIKK